MQTGGVSATNTFPKFHEKIIRDDAGRIAVRAQVAWDGAKAAEILQAIEFLIEQREIAEREWIVDKRGKI